MFQDHLEVCLKFPIGCILNCGENGIPRNMMEDHVTTLCPNAEHLCPFSFHGCVFKVSCLFFVCLSFCVRVIAKLTISLSPRVSYGSRHVNVVLTFESVDEIL